MEKINLNEYTFPQKPLVTMVLLHSNKSELIILPVRTHNVTRRVKTKIVKKKGGGYMFV